MAVYAFVSTSYPRHPGDPGGHFVRAEAQRRAAEGHEVHVVCPGDDRRDGGLRIWGCGGGEAFGWPGVLGRLRERPWRVISAASFCAAAAWRLRSLRPTPDFVVAHFVLPNALLAPRLGQLEVVGHGSDVRLLARIPAPVRATMIHALLSKHATFRFTSAAGLEAVLAGLPPVVARRLRDASRIELPAIDVPTVDGAVRRRRRATLQDGDRPLVAVCGRLVRAKRFHLALDVVRDLDATALVIGDGPERGALERQAVRDRLSARFVGHRPRPSALIDIACADLLLHPSIDEGASTVIREARALGIPVACCASGDVRRWADDDEGLLVTSEAGLATAARGLLGRGGQSTSTSSF